jgi:predicted alpha-1,6-mannanase (GH76 family)
VYWDSKRDYFFTNSDRQIDYSHANGPYQGLYSDFWWEAELWNVVMDAYLRTESKTYLKMIDEVYNGFTAAYPGWVNDYNDDLGWWALASLRAYDITRENRYLNLAKSLYQTIHQSEDNKLGGGVWWTIDGQNAQKNVATNAPFVITSVRLYQLTKQKSYLQNAKAIFQWIDTHLKQNGQLNDHIDAGGNVTGWEFTYNYGTYLGAAAALYRVTHNPVYYKDATWAADYTIANLTNNGILKDEGNGDGGGFKLVFVLNLHQFATMYHLTKYQKFLQENAQVAWSNRRTSDNLMGSDWSSPAPSASIQSLTAAAAVELMQGADMSK